MESNIMQILVFRLQMLLRLTVPVWQISSIPDFRKLENLFQSSVTKGVATKMKKKKIPFETFPLKVEMMSVSCASKWKAKGTNSLSSKLRWSFRRSWDLITLILSRTYARWWDHREETLCKWKGRDRNVFQTVPECKIVFLFVIFSLWYSSKKGSGWHPVKLLVAVDSESCKYVLMHIVLIAFHTKIWWSPETVFL